MVDTLINEDIQLPTFHESDDEKHLSDDEKGLTEDQLTLMKMCYEKLKKRTDYEKNYRSKYMKENYDYYKTYMRKYYQTKKKNEIKTNYCECCKQEIKSTNKSHYQSKKHLKNLEEQTTQ